MKTSIERANAVLRELRFQLSGKTRRISATKTLFQEVIEAAKGIESGVEGVWQDQEQAARVYLAVGKSVGTELEEEAGGIVMRIDKDGQQGEKVRLPLTFDIDRQEWLGEHDNDVAPTPGEPLPRVPGVVVIVRAVSKAISKKK